MCAFRKRINRLVYDYKKWSVPPQKPCHFCPWAETDIIAKHHSTKCGWAAISDTARGHKMCWFWRKAGTLFYLFISYHHLKKKHSKKAHDYRDCRAIWCLLRMDVKKQHRNLILHHSVYRFYFKYKQIKKTNPYDNCCMYVTHSLGFHSTQLKHMSTEIAEKNKAQWNDFVAFCFAFTLSVC